MTPRIQEIFKSIWCSDYEDYEIKQLAVGLLGITLGKTAFDNAANVVNVYRMDDEMELNFEDKEVLS
tara:strand:- start:1074 stop:1274 length:201 start_codon:yes stop_codon:yes gene_type:complete